jgi:hypothetical protein
MSDTPRTDAIAHRGYHLDALAARAIDLCRELERENGELRAAAAIEEERSLYWRAAEDKLKRENAALRAEVNVTRKNYEDYKTDNIALREQLINVTSELTVTKVNALADKERLDSRTILLTESGERVHYVEVNLRAAIDAAREAQP